MTMRATLLVSLVMLCGATTRAAAHQSSVKYVDVTLDGAEARVAITVAPGDVTSPLGLPDDARPSLDDALASRTLGAVASYVVGWLELSRPSGERCVPGPAAIEPDADRRFVVVRWPARCDEPVDQLRLDFSRFFAIDARHEAILMVHGAGEEAEPRVVRSDDPVVVAGRGSSASVFAWVGYGMDHIYGGLDHICFVISLLLVVVIARPPSGDWRVRPPLEALRSTAVIITAFTIAHSVTLIAASLGWIRLPSQLVESLIAASIVYTAIEDVIKPDVRWRFVLTFGFGLIHGLGFASMLEVLLPPTQVVVPLLAFNVGVELGQLTVVIVAIPLLWGVARWIGAARYRRVALPIAAVPLVVIGTKWLIERM